MDIEIICPIFNAENYILGLNQSFLKQKNVNIKKISYVLTESSDNTEKILTENNIEFEKISKQDFSHSTVREKPALESDADILVFVTQDVLIENEDWLEKLVKPIENGECDACYSRQVARFKGIEKYTREKNYPENSFVVSKDDIPKLGLKTFFFSDASSAIKAETFKKLGGYDGKKLPTNEDMYIAYKLIMGGFKIKYCADSVVLHSHKYTLKQVYERYKLTGMFMAENSYLDEFGTNKAGGGLAKYVLVKALKKFDVPVLFRFFPDMLARWLGMRKGKKLQNKIKKKAEKLK